MKATARAHPIQGLLKYHGLRDEEARYPYHDSISLCTAPSHTRTTVAFESDRDRDQFVIDGEPVEGRGEERLIGLVDHVREMADLDSPVRFESENDFPTNVGLGSSSSGFAAAAVALCEAAGLDLSREELSAIARRGSSSAARAVTGGFSHLCAGLNDTDCRSERIETDLGERTKIVVGLVPAYKETEDAHREAAKSHMFDARLAHVHGELAELRDALYEDDFERTFALAERDSLSLAATTMTGPDAWVYWRPETLEIFRVVRELREDGVPAYFSVDTGASVYVNVEDGHEERVESAISDLGVETRVWEVGGPAEILDESEALF
ncbi:diphosphomevalonate decarboxylase [Halobacteriales archaeon QS_3_64_16]|nr:MAG: diphosphomevalonate decarboxylase [Halobacteriales archaeon QS_3_64_16]